MKRRLHVQGGNFLRKWQGEAPQGRSMTALEEQKGQVKADPMHDFNRQWDDSQKAYVRVWEF